MPEQCKLLLDNYTGQYTAGSPIQGRIILSLDSDITLRGLRVVLSGIEHTEWIATESYYDSEANEHKSRDTQFIGDKEVISIKQWLYGDQHATTNLSMGQHIYPFVINLQQNIPSTYQCENGSIYYKLTATVDRPMALDYEDEIMVVVYSPIDLNFIARAEDLQPSSYSDEKTVCCWCCAQGPITMDVELAKQTLIPGEHVEVKMRLTNMANINVTGVSLELKQIISYKVTEPSRDDKTDSHILIDLKDVGLGAHGENTYVFNVSLPPNLVLPNFAQCGLFSVKYIYTATAKLPSTHTNLEVKMYPKVGHIPLGSRFGTPHYNPHPPIEGPQPVLGWANPSAPPLIDNKEQTMEYTSKLSGPKELSPPSYDSLNIP